MIADILADAAGDSIRLLPFLFITYLFIELIEHEVVTISRSRMLRSRVLGPLTGAVLGVIPQCGLSAAAAGLYGERLITCGTLLAIFLSCSDEMLPILIAENVSLTMIVRILSLKVVIGAAAGLFADAWLRFHQTDRIGDMDKKHAAGTVGQVHADGYAKQLPHGCVEEGTAWQDHGHTHQPLGMQIFLHALKHTLEVFIYIFLVTAVLNAVMETGGEDLIRMLFTHIPVVGEFLAALIGLIPNCASSVALTELYLADTITEGTLMAGLLTNSGLGLLTLFRQNKNRKENAAIISFLCVIGIACGVLIDAAGVTF